MTIKKMFTMPVMVGEASERIDTVLKNAPSRSAMQPMRQWVAAGYMLSELGHGIIESLIAMDRDHRWQGLTEQQKAERLIQLLQRTTWDDQWHGHPHSGGTAPNPNIKVQPLPEVKGEAKPLKEVASQPAEEKQPAQSESKILPSTEIFDYTA